MRSLAPIDLFIHDSDHSYLWQRMELDTALHSAAPHAIIACDDASDSYAFMEFCRQYTMGAVYLIETTKVFGLIRL